MEQKKVKKFSHSLFGIILICFLLPFISVSCNGQKCLTLSGRQLITGTTIKYPSGFGYTQEQKIDGEPLALIVFLCATGGLLLSFAKHKSGIIGTTISGVAGLIALLSLKGKLNNDIAREGMGSYFEYLIGYQLMLLCFLLAIGLSIYLIINYKGNEKL
ncbi:MAG: hypothetical protein Q7J67_07865 [bacterium]|nr:hypothetical protein [bacterium]